MDESWMSHVTHTNASYHIFNRMLRSGICCWNEACHTSELKIKKSHISESLITHTNDVCHTYSNTDLRRICCWNLFNAARKNESCHIYEWVMLHIWMSHVTHTMSHITHMNESCHTYGWVMDESCHTYEWVMSRIRMSHVTHMDESCHTCEWVMSHMYNRELPWRICCWDAMSAAHMN